MQYSKELKESILRRILPPNSEPIAKVAKESGLAEQTLRNWKAAALTDGTDSIQGEPSADKWTSQDKFQIVVETIGVNETELAEYAREKGIFVDDIKLWRDACISANGSVAKEAAMYKKELKSSEKEIKRLEKELNRKNAALAETAALLVLRKKADAIWGDPGDE